MIEADAFLVRFSSPKDAQAPVSKTDDGLQTRRLFFDKFFWALWLKNETKTSNSLSKLALFSQTHLPIYRETESL